MTTPAYTVRIFAGTLPTAWTKFYTAEGATEVIRDLRIHSGAVPNPIAQISVQTATGSSAFIVDESPLENNSVYHDEGRVALVQGDELWANCPNGDITAYITGYRFST